MRKFSKTALTVLGVIASLVFVGIMIYNVIEINQLHAVANANRSAEFPNPRNWVLIAAAVGLLAGFLLGAALAMPSKGFKEKYAEYMFEQVDSHRSDSHKERGRRRDRDDADEIQQTEAPAAPAANQPAANDQNPVVAPEAAAVDNEPGDPSDPPRFG